MTPNSAQTDGPKFVHITRVFPAEANGGNPAPICLDCDDMDDEAMRQVAAHFGHESGFVMRPSTGNRADFRIRFFVPNHEMEMCGHATIGALWVLRDLRRISAGNYEIETASGIVKAKVSVSGPISISQPAGSNQPLDPVATSQVLDVLNLRECDLASPILMNAKTSRTKTIVPVKDLDRLHQMAPDYSRVEQVCNAIGSTGLYPFAKGGSRTEFSARQFPRSSGYPEDAATGIAATALAFGLLRYGWVDPTDTVTIRQGEAMGRPSKITIEFAGSGQTAEACWLNGACLADRILPLPYPDLTIGA